MRCKNPLYALFVTFIFILSTALSSSALDIKGLDDYLYPSADKTISMDFRQAPLGEVLKIFSQQSNMNFIAASAVADQSIDIYFDKVPVEEALERILSAHNLTYEVKEDSNVFLVKQASPVDDQLITRVYKLNHATVPTSKINTTLSASEVTGTDASENVETADAGIIATLQSILSDRGLIVEEPRTNSIIISDIPSKFPIIETTLSRLDVRIPQILIEAELLDVSKIISDQLGFSWNQTPFGINLQQSREFYFPYTKKAFSDIGGGNTLLTSNLDNGSFAAIDWVGTLDFLRSHSDTKNLARPRILTLNNQTAEISINTDEAIGVESTSESDTGAITATFEREETGVFLKVTPQANIQTGEILLAVEPRVVESVNGESFPLGAAGLVQSRNAEERGSKSLSRVVDGDTIVLGGLLRTDVSETKTRVPGLHKIPVVGSLFRSKDKVETERELIIFITPHIIREAIASNRTVERNQNLLVREQRMPHKRSREIDRELSLYDSQR